MTSNLRKVTYGRNEIEFRLERRRRKTLEIAVEADKSVTVIAPLDTPHELVEAKLKKRAAWVQRQQLFFDQFHPQTPRKQFLAGETHLYLGRHYRLSVVRHAQEGVKLYRGRLVVQSHKPQHPDSTRFLVETWYRERAKVKYDARLTECLKRFRDPATVNPSGMRIRHLRSRWGSMSAKGVLTLNVRLIQGPTDGIDYVITHELCHLIHPNHGPHFFDLLSRVMPDWPKRKTRLERMLS